ncbi:MAG: LacI family DNA-binding transcriptional regulator [Thomasclavelia sp.]|nr:LacI family DNA-binding transcriptional regulator [Thomasclavelia sp.]
MSKNTTIYDVAREAGVSLATVSRVVNGSSVVKEETKQKVLKVIQQLDFKPNEIARGLATSKTTSIAIVFPSNLFSGIRYMVAGMGDVARHLEYNINMYTSDDLGDGNSESDVAERIIKTRVDGVILFNNDRIDKQIALLEKYNVPIVVVGKKYSSNKIGSVYVDAKSAIGELVDTFIANKKNDILFVKSEDTLINKDDFIEGAKESYKKLNIPFDISKVYESFPSYETTYNKMVDYFKYNKPQVVICGDDKDGVAVINAARTNHIHIPSQMEVVGMLNAEYSMMTRPSLSTIDIHIYDMGAMAVRLLTKFLNDEKIEEKAIAVKHQFIKRNSTL